MKSTKKDIVAMVKLIEENNSTMSDYKFINYHREMSKLVSAVDVDIEICKLSLRYIHRKLTDDEMDSLLRKIVDLEDFHVTETNSFQYRDKEVSILKAFNENEGYIQYFGSEYIRHMNKQGDKKHKYNVFADYLCVTDTGDVYFTDYMNSAIARLSPSGSVSPVFRSSPLEPLGICQSLDGGLLVTLGDIESDSYILDSHSRRLVRHMSLTGDVIRDYEYQEDGQIRLFTDPFTVNQNGNSDVCVVNLTSDDTGNLVILSSFCRLRSIYHGQNLNMNFCPGDISCDSRDNILVTDLNNHRIHLLSTDGEFLKYLLTENEVLCPTALSLYGSTLWVGNVKGSVKVFQY